MPNNDVLITIGITSFNAENSILAAIQSALEQDYRPIEVIIVDDGSTDATVDKVKSFSINEPLIKLYTSKTNHGVASTRNKIIDKARGEVVVFFDDDDESLPDRVSSQYKRLTSYEEEFSGGAPVICHTARQVVYPNGVERIEATMGQRIDKMAPFGIQVAQRILIGKQIEDGNGACPTCSQMARLSTYKAIDGFDVGLRRSEDTDFNIRLALNGGHFVGIERPLVIQKMTQTSEKSIKEEFRNFRFLVNKHRSVFRSEGAFDFALKWLDVKEAWLESKYARFTKLLCMSVLLHPIMTFRRMVSVCPNIRVNSDFRRFHIGDENTARKCQ